MFRLRIFAAALLCSGCFVDSQPEDEREDDEAGTTGLVSTTTGITGISASFTTMDTVATSTTAGPTTANPSTTSADTQDADTQNGDTETTEGADESTSTGAAALTVADLVEGDLIITEVMINPNCSMDNCEWFEVYNNTEEPIDLMNLGIGDRDDALAKVPGVSIPVSVILPPGEVGILAQETLWPYDMSPEPLVTYADDVRFSNSEFELVAIFGPNGVLDETATVFANEAPDDGRSRMLMPDHWDHVDNDESDVWCWSNTVLPSTSIADDWGTPGSPDVVCLPSQAL